MQEFNQMTLKELKMAIQRLDEANVPDDTKVFIDTGWDSIQEVLTETIALEKAQIFQIEDELNGEIFTGYSLLEKAAKMKADGPIEEVIVLKHLY
ncbi:hypothetical protein [Enterococcus aquimarinus]|nr:hypothetical protein [Enterococcus aquimarinus]MCC9274429.1 hypothetical protein [Enterococcus aquimarinus]